MLQIGKNYHNLAIYVNQNVNSIKKADKYASTFWAPDSKTFFIVDDKTLLAINTETGEVTTPEWAEWLKGVYGRELLIPGSD